MRFNTILRQIQSIFSTNNKQKSEYDHANYDEIAINNDSILAKQVCDRVKNNFRLNTAFWNEMHLDFMCNLDVCYDELQLNYEITNSSGVPWYSGDGGLEFRVHVYDAKDNLICTEEEYIPDRDLVKNRYTSFILIHLSDIRKAEYIEIHAWQDI